MTVIKKTIGFRGVTRDNLTHRAVLDLDDNCWLCSWASLIFVAWQKLIDKVRSKQVCVGLQSSRKWETEVFWFNTSLAAPRETRSPPAMPHRLQIPKWPLPIDFLAVLSAFSSYVFQPEPSFYESQLRRKKGGAGKKGEGGKKIKMILVATNVVASLSPKRWPLVPILP